MVYLIVQKWQNTQNNHAGVYHLAKLLLRSHPDKYSIIAISDFKLYNSSFLSFAYNLLFASIFWKFYYILVSIYLLFKVKFNDRIVLFEYLTPGVRQDFIAYILKFFFVDKVRIFGFVHLVPSKLINRFPESDIISRLDVLHGIITFGNSLTRFLNNYVQNKIWTTLHYSDSDFYKPQNSYLSDCIINVLILGQQARNYSQLIELIKNNPHLNYYIISSDPKVFNEVESFPNIKLFSNLTENELLQVMGACHCYLGLYDDVVGSNVLSNCISMGIIPIVSDVGSIRDYLTVSEAFICNSYAKFNDVLYEINQNHAQLFKMREALIEKSKVLTWKNFHNDLQRIIYS